MTPDVIPDEPTGETIDEPDDESPDETTETAGGRQLLALGKPPYDDPDPEAMDRFLEDMVAQIKARDPRGRAGDEQSATEE